MSYLRGMGTGQHVRVYGVWHAPATKAAKGALPCLQFNRIGQLGDLSPLWA